MLTTTAIDVDEELLNRCPGAHHREGRGQARAIHAAQRQSQTLEGLAARTERDQIIAVHRDANRLWESLVVDPHLGHFQEVGVVVPGDSKDDLGLPSAR